MTCQVGNPSFLLDNDSNAGLPLVNYFLRMTGHAMISSKSTKKVWSKYPHLTTSSTTVGLTPSDINFKLD